MAGTALVMWMGELITESGVGMAQVSLFLLG